MERLLFREDVVEYIDSQLGEATGRLFPTGRADVTCFTGPLGVGKTAILAEFRRQASVRGIPAVQIDFSPEAEVRIGYDKWERVSRRYSGESRVTTLLKDVMDGFVRAADAPAAKVIRSHHTPEEAIGVLNDYSQWLKGYLQKPLALTIDHLEQAPAGTDVWLKETLLPGICDVGRRTDSKPTLVTMAGRKPLYRSRMETLFVEPFTREQTRMVAQSLELEGKTLYAATGGLPLLINYAHELSGAGVNDLKEQVTNTVERVILPGIQPADVDGLLALSVLSRFDIPTVMAVTGKTRPHVWRLLGPLIDSGVVGDHDDGYGYRVVSGLQTPFHRYVRDVKPDEHTRVHEAAAAYAYYDVREGDHAAVVEVLWSRACLGDTPEQLAAQLGDVIRTAASVLPDHRYTEIREKIAGALEDEDFADILPAGTIPLLELVMERVSLPDRQDS